MKITNVTALEILDSRGNPTVRTLLELEDKTQHTDSVASGASTGSHEAMELRDNDSKRYGGKGVLNAVENVNTIIRQAILGREANPTEIDKILLDLDGTENKSKLGANAMLAVSMAVTRGAAHAENKPLWKYLRESFFSQQLDLPAGQAGVSSQKSAFPRLMVNIVNGGRHANWNFDIQEFMIVPNSSVPNEAVQTAAEIFHALSDVLKKRGLSTLVGDEGGDSPALSSNEEVFEVIIEAAKNAGYKNVADYRISIDSAANEFFRNGSYHLRKPDRSLTSDELSSYYSLLTNNYSLLSIEDAFSEDDWEAWKRFVIANEVKQSQTQGVAHSQTPHNDELIIIGDDLFTTNPTRIERGIEEKAANGVLIKLNQIGTVSETIDAIKLGQGTGWKVAISHRSGETEDSFIADLAYACAADFLKAGSMSRSERLAKYNRLLEIESGL